MEHSTPEENEATALETASTFGPEEHFVYIVRCNDGTLYTGYTKNMQQRIGLHNAGKGAKYTQSRRPVILLAFWSFETKKEALQTEYAIKQLSRARKEQLIINKELKV